MRIGVISDTHIPQRASAIPEKVYDRLRDTDLILHAGDITELSVLNSLAEIAERVEAVAGNMDNPAVRSSLPAKKIIDAGGIFIGLIHGWGPPFGLRDRIQNEFKNSSLRVIVFGHSHSAEKVIENGVMFLNPGSAVPGASCSLAVLTVKNAEIDAEIIRL